MKAKLRKPKVELIYSDLYKVKQIWQAQRHMTAVHDEYVAKLERLMAEATGIKDIEFIRVDGEIIGVCNKGKTMRQIEVDELGNGKDLINYA